MEVEPFEIARQYEEASCRIMACLGFCKLSHGENGEVVGDFACFFKLLKFVPIYTF